MTHKDIAINILAQHIVALMAYDDESRRLFKTHVFESLDWYEYTEEDQDKIYNEIVKLVGDFSQPFE